MKRIVNTNWFYFYFKEDITTKNSESNHWHDGIWKKNYWRISKDSLEENLNKLQEYCNENQYEIKAVMPLSRAESHNYGQSHIEETRTMQGIALGGWGLGYGWAIGMIDGYAIMLQSIEEVSDQEFSRRKKIKEINKKIVAAKDDYEKSEESFQIKKAELELHREKWAGINLKINELERKVADDAYDDLLKDYDIQEKKKLFKTVYIFESNEFESRAEAENARTSKIERMRIQAKDSYTQKINSLKSEYRAVANREFYLQKAQEDLNIKSKTLLELENEFTKLQEEAGATET